MVRKILFRHKAKLNLQQMRHRQNYPSSKHYYINDTFLQMTCELTLRLGYVNSSDVFEQTYEFFLMIPKQIDKHTVAHFESIESSI